MMSFYGAPLDDLDAAIAADPRWILPRADEGRLPAEPHRAGARRREARPLLDDAASLAASANARERGHLVALQRLAAGDWARRRRRLVARSCASIRATRSPCSGRTCSTSIAATRRSCSARVEPRAAGVARRRSAPALRARAARLRPRGIGPLRRGRGRRPARARRRGARAVGDPRRRPRDGDAGPARRGQALAGRVAAALGRARRRRPATASPATSAGTRRCSRSRRSTPRRRSRCYDALPRRGADRDHAAARRRGRRCSGASRLLGADVGDRWRALLAGWRLDAARRRPVGVQRRARDARADRRGRARPRRATGSAPSLDRGRATHAAGTAPSRATSARRCSAACSPSARGDFDAAVDAIAPLRRRLEPLGGSRAQRDVVDQTLLAAASASAARDARRAPLLDERGARQGADAAHGVVARAAGVSPRLMPFANACRCDGRRLDQRRRELFRREGALHRRPLEHAAEPGRDVRQAARGPAEAARPAAEHERVGIGQRCTSSPSSHGPPQRASWASSWSSIAPTLRFGMRLHDRGAGARRRPSARDRSRRSARRAPCSRARPATCTPRPARGRERRHQAGAPDACRRGAGTTAEGLVQHERRCAVRRRRRAPGSARSD